MSIPNVTDTPELTQVQNNPAEGHLGHRIVSGIQYAGSAVYDTACNVATWIKDNFLYVVGGIIALATAAYLWMRQEQPVGPNREDPVNDQEEPMTLSTITEEPVPITIVVEENNEQQLASSVASTILIPQEQTEVDQPLDPSIEIVDQSLVIDQQQASRQTSPESDHSSIVIVDEEEDTSSDEEIAIVLDQVHQEVQAQEVVRQATTPEPVQTRTTVQTQQRARSLSPPVHPHHRGRFSYRHHRQ